MFLKIFFLAFILIAAASGALAFAMLMNKPDESCHNGNTGDDTCGACGVSGACSLHDEM